MLSNKLLIFNVRYFYVENLLELEFEQRSPYKHWPIQLEESFMNPK